MIIVGGQPALRAKRDHYLRTKLSDMQSQVTNYTVQILAIELSIGIIEHVAARDFENFTGCGKFSSPHGDEFGIIFGAATMGCGLTRGETDYAGLDAAGVV